jgi:hydrogenase nickel incorporation protein HypA/HybF
MHELSIAHSLVELAAKAAQEAGATRVHAVRIVVGAFSGVSIDSLLFCYDIVTRDTLLEKSQLSVRSVPLRIHCAPCAREVELPDLAGFRCPACGTPSADIRAGRELFIESLEIDSDAADGEVATT